MVVFEDVGIVPIYGGGLWFATVRFARLPAGVRPRSLWRGYS